MTTAKPLLHQGRCACGWTGPARIRVADADRDLAEDSAASNAETAAMVLAMKASQQP